LIPDEIEAAVLRARWRKTLKESIRGADMPVLRQAPFPR
jgi:hypothetical protein